jgi:3-hydroxymyristoyl/3-hydroxydecanoyl-(acyl carrier protein) dehydratase
MPSQSDSSVDAAALSAAPSRLPHAPPFRLIDRVLAADLLAGTLVAQRRLTANCGLWPAESSVTARTGSGAIMASFPDVLIIEALCQAAACFNILEASADRAAATRPHLGYLVAISGFRFRQDFTTPHFGRPRIGDTLLLHVTRQSKMGNLIAFSATARAQSEDGKAAHEVASGQLLFALA